MSSKYVEDRIKNSLLDIDPIHWSQKHLTLDGNPYRVFDSGYRPIAEIMRYVGIKALEKDSKPVVWLKSRQVSGTITSAVIEMFFMASGLFGNGNNPPMRVAHVFPFGDHAADFSKTKLSAMIDGSVLIDDPSGKRGQKPYLRTLIDTSSALNDNVRFKQFKGGNHIWIESAGLEGNRLRGKQLCLDTELPTPDGFVKLKDLKEGQELFDEKGNICKIIKLHPINETPEAYRIIFDDGTTVDACAEHLWVTYAKKDRYKKNTPPILKIRNTKEILNTLKVGKYPETNHSIKNCEPIKYREKELIIDPYLLGLWLGDGSKHSGSIETSDPEIFNNYEHRIVPSSIREISKSANYRIIGLTTKLNKYNLICNKHIPDTYMKSSVEQRFALLQGLMDTDAHCDKTGRVEFCSVLPELAQQVRELALSLGIKASIIENVSYLKGKRCKNRFRINFVTRLPVFRLDRKLKNIKKHNRAICMSTHRYIVDIKKIDPKPMRCLTVDSPSHMFLITRKFIPTHNTLDGIVMDECFPYEQCVETNNGKMEIGYLYNKFIKNEQLPLVKTFNENSGTFEYKSILKVYKREPRQLIQINCDKRKIKCTPNHRFLTEDYGWVRADELLPGMLIKSSGEIDPYMRALNDDQKQIILGSFLGNGNLDSFKQSKYRVRVTHGIGQEEYAKWKADIFGVKTTFIEKNGYAQTSAITFETKIFGLDQVIPSDKTYCPQRILDNIDARGIAIWFMDNGSIHYSDNCEHASGVLNTAFFDEDSHTRFVEKFKSLGIDCYYSFYVKKGKNKKYFQLNFNKDGLEKLSNLIRPYIHFGMSHKIENYSPKTSNYIWNYDFLNHSLTVFDKKIDINKEEVVYDLSVEDNHNFILASAKRSKNVGGPICHNCQDIPAAAIANSIKTLTKAQYGPTGEGVQLYFGTPKQRGSNFWHMWQQSSQQYYHLGCSRCNKFFPLYTPGSNEWETIWLYENVVRCTHCGCEQDRIEAINRGKWIATKDSIESKFVGFHLNRLYLPEFTKEKILSSKPENSAINTERSYQNEVLGEFFQGEAAIITPEDIREKCGDLERKCRGLVSSQDELITFLGVDIGAKADLEQLADSDKVKSQAQGQSYSTAVVLSLTGPGKLSIEYAFKFKRNDLASKKSVLDETIKRYKIKLAICDIGYANDFNEIMQTEYGDRFLSSQASGVVNGKAKYNPDIFPKIIAFERDHWIMDLYDQMKKGLIRFPLGSYEQIGWLIQHCCNMEIKPSISRTGDVNPHYIKSGPNDGFMSLLNAYIAYKFYITEGFKIKNPLLINDKAHNKPKASVISVYAPRQY